MQQYDAGVVCRHDKGNGKSPGKGASNPFCRHWIRPPDPKDDGWEKNPEGTTQAEPQKTTDCYAHGDNVLNKEEGWCEEFNQH